jgi:N-acyl homoserine lactone hydrolase
MLRWIAGWCLAMLAGGLWTLTFQAQAQTAKLPQSLRLYVFDCGIIHTTNVDAYSLKKEEVGSTEMSIPCFLIAHPKGAMMWDNGDIPDSAFKPGGGPAELVGCP